MFGHPFGLGDDLRQKDPNLIWFSTPTFSCTCNN